MKGPNRLALLVSLTGIAAVTARAQPASEPLEEVEVVGTTPLGSAVDPDKIAANVQSAAAEEIARQRALDLSELMQRSMSGVFVNDAQNNPLQPDLQYRGFTGSPLLGLPQGIAVYQDGVRVNEPFGDTVNWALIPDSAIDTVYLTYADTDLIGNGAAPVELLELDRSAIFTRPDQTENELTLISVTVEQELASALVLTGNAYVRGSDIDTYNGDDSDFDACEDSPGLLCGQEDDDEEVVLDAAGEPVPTSDAVEGATVNRTSTSQRGEGLSLQANWRGTVAGRDNQLVVGLAHDASDIAFAASTELGMLDATRLAVPSGVLVGGSFTRMDAETANTGLYVSNVLTLSSRATLTLSGRFNRTDVTLRDRLGTALDGDHEFTRFNPAAGFTFAAADALTAYVSYSESNRAPSPVELTCADEDDPCRLPNAFLADPPLEQVVAGTLEAGVRGRFPTGRWHAGVFRTENEDDILFISAGALTNEGFFDNVGETRRDGIELGVDGELERLSWFANFTYLDATFRETLAVPSPNNPAAVGGEVRVRPGDRLPLIPSRLLKAGWNLDITRRLSFGGNVLASSGRYARGDEGNDTARIDGYALLNLRGELDLGERVSVFVAIDNVLDEEYSSFGLFGEADDVLGDELEDACFLGPGAPRAARLGIGVAS